MIKVKVVEGNLIKGCSREHKLEQYFIYHSPLIQFIAPLRKLFAQRFEKNINDRVKFTLVLFFKRVTDFFCTFFRQLSD